MTDEPKKPKLELVQPPKDALDISSLWLDPALGTDLTDRHYHTVPVGKPKAFFRVNPDPKYRRLCELVVYRPEGQIEDQYCLVAPAMWGKIDEARRCILVTCIDREGAPRLWALKLPRDGEKDNDAWISARRAAKVAEGKWVKPVWNKRAYETRDAQPGYAPDPDWKKLPPFDELVRLAVGAAGIIQDENHPVARDLLGAAPSKAADEDDGLGDNNDDAAGLS
jgi:hypothetical protein